MSEIVPIPPEEFHAVRPVRSAFYPDVIAVMKLQPGEALRIKEHGHEKFGHMQRCRAMERIARSSRRHGLTVQMRHDGPDLLVLRDTGG